MHLKASSHLADSRGRPGFSIHRLQAIECAEGCATHRWGAETVTGAGLSILRSLFCREVPNPCVSHKPQKALGRNVHHNKAVYFFEDSLNSMLSAQGADEKQNLKPHHRASARPPGIRGLAV